MPTFTIKTRDVGTIEFTVPHSGGYVRIGEKQICYGGAYRSETISCSESDLPRVARAWNNQRRRAAAKNGF